MSRNENIFKSPSHCLQEAGSLLKLLLLCIDRINQTSYVQVPFATVIACLNAKWTSKSSTSSIF